MKVLLTKPLPKDWIEELHTPSFELLMPEEGVALSSEKLISLAQQCDALMCVGTSKLDGAFFEACPNLKGIALMSVGYDHVSISSANKYQIPVSNTPEVLSNATADVAFLLMLSVSRDAFQNHKRISNNDWKFFNPTANLGQELYGKTLGIFGLGRIGIELAKKAKAAYQMNIIYHNRNNNEEAERELNATYVSFEDLLAQSDVLSVHANLSEQTQDIFNADAFSKMKSNAIFINTARGGLHNEQDLILALQQKQIWGAGLDVTNPEPMQSDNPLLDMNRVCVLPHIGSATSETRKKMAKMAADNLAALAKGLKMPQVVNAEVYQQ